MCENDESGAYVSIRRQDKVPDVQSEWLFRPIRFGYHLPVEDVTQRKLQVNKPPSLGPNPEVLPQMHHYPNTSIIGINTITP